MRRAASFAATATQAVAILLAGIIIGATMTPAQASEEGDIHRIAAAVEKIAQQLERCR